MSSALAGPAALPLVLVEHCMGTVFSIRVAAPGIDRATLDRALDWLHAMDAMFSTYRSDSQISLLDSGALRPADASPEVRAVLAECDRLAGLTDGYFSTRPDGRRLDPSGYVKGWAIQGVADRLRAGGSVNHCVNGGGDVACEGRPADGRGWRIGITDPADAGRLLGVIEAPGPLAVATSGLAERGAHILDPHTGEPATGIVSATVVAADLVTADVYATAAVAMGPDRARAWLAGLGMTALLVSADGDRLQFGDWTAMTAGPRTG